MFFFITDPAAIPVLVLHDRDRVLLVSLIHPWDWHQTEGKWLCLFVAWTSVAESGEKVFVRKSTACIRDLVQPLEGSISLRLASRTHPWIPGCQGSARGLTSQRPSGTVLDRLYLYFLLSFPGFYSSCHSSPGSHRVDECLLVWQLCAAWNYGALCARPCRFLARGNPAIQLAFFLLLFFLSWDFWLLGFWFWCQWHFKSFCHEFHMILSYPHRDTALQICYL